MENDFSITIVMENGENCFQTHEEKQENNWVIPVGIEQKNFIGFWIQQLLHLYIKGGRGGKKSTVALLLLLL